MKGTIFSNKWSNLAQNEVKEGFVSENIIGRKFLGGEMYLFACPAAQMGTLPLTHVSTVRLEGLFDIVSADTKL